MTKPTRLEDAIRRRGGPDLSNLKPLDAPTAAAADVAADAAEMAGTVRRRVDLPALRARLGLSQSQFSEAYGIPLAALRNWEQGRREPDGAALAYLVLIAQHPAEVAALRGRPAA